MREFAFDGQVASQAEAVAAALASTDPPTLDPAKPLVFTGIGTSWHACRVASYWVTELSRGRVTARAVEAHELALRGPLAPGDQVVVVSHRGSKRFPLAVLARARELGALTVAVTGQGNPDIEADHVMRTCPDERASTHSVSYLTALAVLGELVGRTLGASAAEFLDRLHHVPDPIAATLALPAPVEVAARLAGRSPLVVTGFGIDAITAAEAALKLKEGAYVFAEGLSEEFALHGTPAAFDAEMAGILISPGGDDAGRFTELAELLATLGLEVVTCGPPRLHELAFADVPYLLRPLVTIIPLQRLVGELARIRGSNPDTTRSDQEPWASAIGRIRL